ncbi:Zn(II)2Cys6 transcription factor, partial [Aspergillus saccharolyticus JOP 1030-1]
PARKRHARGIRSRTGCRTCRIRRIKCDESPEKCRNCTSTGRLCDGYELYRLPMSARPKKNRFLLTSPPVSAHIRWAATSDERRCLSFFCNRTIPDATGYYDTHLWEQFVFQMANLEPAVCHAVIALGAAHQDVVFQGINLAPTGARQRGVWYFYALEESARAFELLRRRNTQDPQMRQVMLLCCLLFVYLNLVQRDYETAFQHLHAGLRVFSELEISGCRSLPCTSPGRAAIDPHLITAFAQLETQTTHLSAHNRPQLWANHPGPGHLSRRDHSNLPSESVDDRRLALQPLENAIYRFFKRCWNASADEVFAHYQVLHATKTHLLSEVQHAKQSFSDFCDLRYAALSPKEQRGTDLIRLHLMAFSVGLRTSLILHQPDQITAFTAEYAAMLSLARKIIAQFPDKPTVMVDSGVILPLYIIADCCQDLSLRWQAIQELRAWPHYEGPYDSMVTSTLLTE